MFEQCLPYKDLSLEKELTCDVLIDDDDLLSQLSSQLDIPSFVDQGKPEVCDDCEVSRHSEYCRYQQTKWDNSDFHARDDLASMKLDAGMVEEVGGR